jgi:hypothetical protein
LTPPPPLNDELLPPSIARRFAAEAASTLTNNEIQALIQFLQQTFQSDRRALYNLVQPKLEKFYAAEKEESSKSCERLGTPSGPENADIGLIMHCRTKAGQIGEFWEIGPAFNLVEEFLFIEKQRTAPILQLFTSRRITYFLNAELNWYTKCLAIH